MYHYGSSRARESLTRFVQRLGRSAGKVATCKDRGDGVLDRVKNLGFRAAILARQGDCPKGSVALSALANAIRAALEAWLRLRQDLEVALRGCRVITWGEHPAKSSAAISGSQARP
jgi:hypothetical protein